MNKEDDKVQGKKNKASTVTSYSEALHLASRNDLLNIKYFTPFGGGVNKKAYGVNNTSWVVLCAPTSKRRLIQSEINQILLLSKNGVHTPDLGGGEIFNVSENDNLKIAFLEEKINGFEIPRAGTAFTQDEVMKFGLEVVNFICSEAHFETAKRKLSSGIESIERLIPQIKINDIPDFQVRLDRNSGRILTLDPGDPLNSENAMEKHLRWLDIWIKTLTDKRYLSRIWNEKNPDAKISRDGKEW
jgi:hypothetical protein